MGFDKIKNKSASMGKKSMSAFLKVNKYENPQTVLDLISHICTSGMDLSVQNEFIPYRDKYSKLEEDYSKVNTREAENPFVNDSISDLIKGCNDPFAMMPVYLDHSGFSDAINVAVVEAIVQENLLSLIILRELVLFFQLELNRCR